MAVAFNEMFVREGECRRGYEFLQQWLESTPPDVLAHRRAEAELLFRRIGITFSVYGEAEAEERIIPFDIIPRVLTKPEWDRLAARPRAARPRAQHVPRRHLRRRRDPQGRADPARARSTATPISAPRWPALKLPHGIYVQIAGIDVVRVDDNDFYVLEDNARTPSGVSYMLENREVMMRLFPDLFAFNRIAPVENYPEELLATLNSVAPLLGAGGADRRPAHARAVQQRLLRALLPRRQARRRAGRGPRPAGARQRRLHAHHRGAEARRRDLSPPRRRFPRSPHLPPRFRARRARA